MTISTYVVRRTAVRPMSQRAARTLVGMREPVRAVEPVRTYFRCLAPDLAAYVFGQWCERASVRDGRERVTLYTVDGVR